MTSPAASGPTPETSPGRDRWLQSWLVVLAATLVVLVFVAAGLPGPDRAPVGNAAAASLPSADPPAAVDSSASPSAPASADPAASAGPSTSASPAGAGPAPGRSPAPARDPMSTTDQQVLESDAAPFPAAGVLQLPGRAPVRGSGRFEFANSRGPVAGSRGPVRRYRVAVEKGSNEGVEAFAAQVTATLGDSRSWIGNGRERLQPVTGAERADFTVYLATRETAGRMCARGGTNIRIGGVPYTSCRTTGAAIINLDRWHGSARPFVEAGTDLATYRQYVINHEVGHELGHRHQDCPKAGGPAPVMVQQTITLRGCRPYAWPRRNNRGFSGPLR